MEKIVITGGLGYIGTELCKLYSGETRYKKIVVIDNRFVSERVKQLRDWNIDFIEGDILDKKLMHSHLSDADIVYHLAGITDVAYTKTDEDEEKDKLINITAVEGSQNIINSIPKNCKIIFPSTHVVFEGYDKTKHDLTEKDNVKPVLTYSSGKVQTENDLINSDRNYIILRLATVIGYSTDTMRINIMPNLFSKIASQNGTIKLFSGGIQHKSLVTIFDVVRCLKYLAEAEKINNEIFHCSSTNITVKEVAQICKTIQPSLEIIETDDEIPNLGYTISNKKLLSTGFKFLYDTEKSIKEMIYNWSSRKQLDELEFLQGGTKEYIDDRGKISNYELTEPINLIGYIESKPGTIRANHYHPIQEQKCLLINGKYISVIQDLAEPDSVIETNIINAGDLSVIKPNVAHTMVFLEDSIFLNLVRGEREHENYGITHTMFYELVDENLKNIIVNHYKTECRCCGSNQLKTVISLGMSPLANNLPKNKDENEEMYPLEMKYCPVCHNCQLSCVVPSNKMFDNYLYVSSTNKTFRKHFLDMANDLVIDYNLNNESLVIDIGSNDGVFLKPLKEKGVRILGIDPAENICHLANKNGIETIKGYFNHETANKILKEKGKANIITAFNVFAHADNLKEIATSAFNLLVDDGVFVIEVQYLLDTIKDLTFDNIYHEHVNYWSVTSLNYFFNDLGFEIFKVKHVDTHGGSIRVYISKPKKNKMDKSVKGFINTELDFGITNFNTYKDFSIKIKSCKQNVLNKLNEIKTNNESIVGYGSPAKATTVLNYYGISNDYIDYIIEDNELKHDRFLPGMKIPIRSKNNIMDKLPNYILVLAWNFFDDIISNNKDLVEAGCKFITLKQLEKE